MDTKYRHRQQKSKKIVTHRIAPSFFFGGGGARRSCSGCTSYGYSVFAIERLEKSASMLHSHSNFMAALRLCIYVHLKHNIAMRARARLHVRARIAFRALCVCTQSISAEARGCKKINIFIALTDF